MKKYFPLLMLLIISVNTFGQKSINTKAYYLRKSKNQIITGVVLFTAGTGMIVAGAIIGSKNTDAEDLGSGPNFDEGMWLVIPGLAADIISIPLFISSYNNRKMAFSVGINTQQINYPVQNGYSKAIFPSLALTLKL